MYDLHGRLVRTVTLVVRDGRAEAALDAVDHHGDPLPTGVYLVRVITPSGPVTGRVAYVR